LKYFYSYLIALTFTFCSSCSDEPDNTTISSNKIELIQQLIDSVRADSDAIGIFLLIAVKASSDVLITSGSPDHNARSEFNLDYRFRTGSITKTFTASVILQLADQGKLSLSDKLSDFELPKILMESIPYSDEITIEQLLNMTSGLFNYTEDNEFQNLPLHPFEEYENYQLISYIYSKDCYSRPGAGYHYNNTSYILLGMIAENVTGINIEELIENRFLLKYQLAKTYFPKEHYLPEPYVKGYLYFDENNQEFTDQNVSWAGAAGALVTTFSDLRQWSKIFASGDFISGEVKAARANGNMIIHGSDTVEYACGMIQMKGYLGHSGDIPGYKSIALTNPANGNTILILANNNNPSMIELVDEVIDIIEEN
jgi:D-alanyl-D-alanine carboxypeptidase